MSKKFYRVGPVDFLKRQNQIWMSLTKMEQKCDKESEREGMTVNGWMEKRGIIE